MTGEPVYLIACSATKRTGRHEGRNLYTGDLFVAARAYVEATGAPWFILSAGYGLLRPDRRVDWYDRHLRGLSADQRRAWGARIRLSLEDEGLGARRFVAFAGRFYREALDLPPDQLSAPLAGLGIGQQKAWFKANPRPWATGGALPPGGLSLVGEARL